MDSILKLNSGVQTRNVTVAVENFTFYSKSGYFYFTGKAQTPLIDGTLFVVEKNDICQFKFTVEIENFSPTNFFTSSLLTLEVERTFTECLVKGQKAKRFVATKVVSYENNFRTIANK